MKFDKILLEQSLILTEGAVIERIRRGEFSYELDKYVENAGMIYDDNGKLILEKIYNQYISVAYKFGLPIIIFTPTWRANPERLKLAGFKNKNVNADCFRFLSKIRDNFGNYSKKIFIGGLIGCKGDSYKPEEALSNEEAYIFHKSQVRPVEPSLCATCRRIFAVVPHYLAHTIPLTLVGPANKLPVPRLRGP